MGMLACTFPVIFIILTVIQESVSWPEGTYGLPMSYLGCPLSYGFVWEEGSRTQKTQPGSHGMDDNHLAGIDSTKDVPTDKLTSSFCIKTSFPQENKWTWEAGRYCIYKRDTCPDGFQPGWIYWDDSVPIVGSMQGQSSSGTLPDGEYNRNTLIQFCCRKDGYAHHAINLPNESPFYLLRYGGACQQVERMVVKEEWVYWAGTDNINWDGQDGMYPYTERSSFPTVFTRMYYCYYEPEPPNDKLGIIVTIAYVIMGVAAFVFIMFIVVCVAQRCSPCARKNSEPRHNAESENMMPPAETTVIYRHGAKQPKLTLVPRGTQGDAASTTPKTPPTAPELDPNSTLGREVFPQEPRNRPRAGGPVVLADSGIHRPLQPGELEPLNPGAAPVVEVEGDRGPMSPDPRPLSLPPAYDEVMSRVYGDRPAGDTVTRM